MIADDLQPLAQPINELKSLPNNPRKGDVEAVMRSYETFGQRKPVVALRDGTVIAGNHQLEAAKRLGWTELAVVFVDDDDTTAQAFALADNRTAELGTYDKDALAAMLQAVSIDKELLEATAYTMDDVKDLLTEIEPLPPITGDPDQISDSAPSKTVRGDVWILGNHRLMCGDSTSPTDVQRLMAGKKTPLLHADPPYGMGKEKDGVANDNLYKQRLDEFQLLWWATYRPFMEENGSLYIWGNPEDLWRLWYLGGLGNDENLTFKNEIVWDKINGFGQSSDAQRSYSISTERCLFLMLGVQQFNNNSDNYWQGWEPLRNYLNNEMEKCGGQSQWRKALGNQMGSHYFTKSQWVFPTQEAYEKLQTFGAGQSFTRDYDELKKEHTKLKRDYDKIKHDFYGTRAYFDNTHDNMNEVWNYSRVFGDERYGHATPKPVEMIARAIKSSAPENTIVVEPFAGTGTTLMAAHATQRICYTMELDEHYCDIICKRFQQATGIKPIAEATGQEHDFLTE